MHVSQDNHLFVYCLRKITYLQINFFSFPTTKINHVVKNNVLFSAIFAESKLNIQSVTNC